MILKNWTAKIGKKGLPARPGARILFCHRFRMPQNALAGGAVAPTLKGCLISLHAKYPAPHKTPSSHFFDKFFFRLIFLNPQLKDGN
jgi:hypothetical protein